MRRLLVALVCVAWVCRVASAQEEVGEKRPKPGARPAVAPEARAGEEPEAEKRIKDILKTKKVTFDFVDTPIGDAMNFIQALIGVNMVVDPGLDKGVPLTLRVNDMAVGQALQWMAKLIDAKMDVRDGAIVIARAKDGEREFVEKPRGEKGPPKGDFDKQRRHGQPFGKITLPLGNGGNIELTLDEDDLGPEIRGLALRLLHRQLVGELAKQDPQAAAEFREAMQAREAMERRMRQAMMEERMRALQKEAAERARRGAEDARERPPKPPKPEERGGDNKGQF